MSRKLNTTPGLIDGGQHTQTREKWIGAGRKEDFFFCSYSNSGSVAQRLTVFELMQWREWHDGSWVADHILRLSWRCAWLVWLLTQIECSHRRWTLSQTQGHWWLTYAWWLALLHQNYWCTLFRRFLGMQPSVWIYLSIYLSIWDILVIFWPESERVVHYFPIYYFIYFIFTLSFVQLLFNHIQNISQDIYMLYTFKTLHAYASLKNVK